MSDTNSANDSPGGPARESLHVEEGKAWMRQTEAPADAERPLGPPPSALMSPATSDGGRGALPSDGAAVGNQASAGDGGSAPSSDAAAADFDG
jgi:hypothetical protein